MTDSDGIAALNRWPYVDPRPDPLPVPDTAWNEEPCRCVVLNAKWATHLLGVIDRLLEPDAWSGTDEEKFTALQAMEEIQAQLSAPCDMTGPQGPQGETGPQGPTGPAGPGVEMRTLNGCKIQWRVTGGSWITLLDVCALLQTQAGSCADSGYSSGCTGSSSGDSEEGDMGQVVTDVQIVNGKLRVFFGPCCYKDLGSVSDLVDTTDRSSDLPEDLQPENNPLDVRCQKAHAITGHIWDMVNLLCVPPTFKGCGGELKAAYPDISFDQADLIVAFAHWASTALKFIGTDFNDTNFRLFKCQLYGVFEDTWAISSDEFNAMKTVARNTLPASEGYIVINLINAVGPGDWNNLAFASAANADEENCECPGAVTPTFDPLTDSWYLGEWSEELSLTNTQGSGVFDTAYIDNHELAEDCFGWALILISRTAGQVKGCTPAEAGIGETGSAAIVKGGATFSIVPGAIQLTCNALAFNDIVAANPSMSLSWAGEEDANSNDFSNDPESPTFVAGAYINWAFRHQWDETTGLIFKVAPLFNAASPSHSA